jgi:hypothetical protein
LLLATNCLPNAFAGPQEAPLSWTGLHQFNDTNGRTLEMEQMLEFHSTNQIRNTMWSRLLTSRPARRPFATVAPLSSCRSSTSVPTVPMSRTELDSSLLHGISTGRGVVGVLAVLRGAPEVTPAWQRRRDERRQAAPAAGVEGRV